MAKIVTKKATVETAFGNKLDTPLTFSYKFEELEYDAATKSGDEIPADEMPGQEGLISYVNQKRNATARSKAQAEVLEANGVKKPTKEDPAFRLKTMIDMLVANGDDAVTAEATARQLLKM